MRLWWLCAFLVLPLSTFARVTWVGPDCQFSWRANPPEEFVEGYRIYVESTTSPLSITQQDVGNVTEITCSVLGLAQGRYEAYVTAYNPAGESGPSMRLPFALATVVPGEPGGVGAPQELRIRSVGVMQ